MHIWEWLWNNHNLPIFLPPIPLSNRINKDCLKESFKFFQNSISYLYFGNWKTIKYYWKRFSEAFLKTIVAKCHKKLIYFIDQTKILTVFLLHVKYKEYAFDKILKLLKIVKIVSLEYGASFSRSNTKMFLKYQRYLHFNCYKQYDSKTEFSTKNETHKILPFWNIYIKLALVSCYYSW